MSEYPKVVKRDESDSFYFKNLTDYTCKLVFIKSSDVKNEGDEIKYAEKAVDLRSEGNEYFSSKKISLASNHNVSLREGSLLNYYIVVHEKEDGQLYPMGKNPKGSYVFQ